MQTPPSIIVDTLRYTGQFAGKISEQEARDVLEGRLPDGTEVPVYPFEEFKQGIAELPIRYGVILDYELARQSLSGYVEIEVLKDDPNMIVRTGGVEATHPLGDRPATLPQPLGYLNPWLGRKQSGTTPKNVPEDASPKLQCCAEAANQGLLPTSDRA